MNSTLSKIALAAALAAWPAAADVLLVPSEYPTIQDAANAALPGDEIRVSPGIYDGFSVFEPITVTGLGASASDTVVTGAVSTIEGIVLENLQFTGGVSINAFDPCRVSDCLFRLRSLEIEFAPTTIERTEFRGALDSALVVRDSTYTVDDCVFRDAQTSDNGAAIRVTDSTLTVDDTLFENNFTLGSGGAVFASTFAADLTFTNVVFNDNYADGRGSAIFYDSSFGGACRIFETVFENHANVGQGCIVFIATGDDTNAPGSIVASTFRRNVSLVDGVVCFGSTPASPVGTTEFCANTIADIVGPFFDVGGNTFSPTCPCPADVNMDGMLTPTDFTAWINAFNNALPGCDQNGDGLCTPTDFTAWINNYNTGC